MLKNQSLTSSSIRKSMREKRFEFYQNSALYSNLSLSAQTNTMNTDIWKKSENIALYMPFRGEVDTKLLIDTAYLEKKNVFFPRVICLDTNNPQGLMDFIQVTKNDFETSFETGAYGILEPKKDINPTPLPKNSLVILPCLAYNSKGYRLGYGGGYYDRLLAINTKYEKNSPYYIPLILAFAFQENSTFISDSWDMNALYISNEKETLCTL